MSNELLRTRIGNTVTVVLPVLTRGDAVSLVGRDITIMLVDPNERKTPVSFTIGGVSNNIATFVVEGTSQTATGTYRAEVYENYRGTAMAVYDCDIFVLVARTEYENDGNEGVSSETTTLDPINIAWVGRDGYTPYIQDGYWYINGTSTNVKAAGENGDTPYIENGYWYIGGVSTGIKVDYTNEEEGRAASEQVRVAAEAARVQAEAARTLAENNRLTEESGRSAAEGVRILAERDRQAAETTRQTQEEIRHDNEEARVEAELGRAASEASRAQVEATRVANESARTTAEATRAANEQTRVAEETDRAAAETARIAAETARETAEDGRTSAEATRVSNEQTRVSNESTRQSNESARQSAETARQAAYVAAENARDAAFAAKEATRDAANEAALNCADTLAELGPKLNKVEVENTDSTDEQQVWSNDAGTDEYAKIDSNGVWGKNLKYKDGTSVKDVKTELAGKMPIKTIDSTPTTGSSNLVTSGGVKQAIDNAAKYKDITEDVSDSSVEKIEITDDNGKTYSTIEIDESTANEDEQIWGNDAGTDTYAKINSQGVHAKKFFTLDGREVGGTSIPNLIVVDAAGNGDYTSLVDALNNAGDTQTKHVTILVMAGTYEMPPKVSYNAPYVESNRNLTIRGVNRNKCILTCNIGFYDYTIGTDCATLRLMGNVTIENLTIISSNEQYDSKAGTEGYVTSRTNRKSAYCLHFDQVLRSGDMIVVRNCKLMNKQMACIGFGLREDSTIRIEDCDLECEQAAADSEANDYGTIWGHNAAGADVGGQRLEIINNRITHKTGQYAVRLSYTSAETTDNLEVSYLLVGNVVNTTNLVQSLIVNGFPEGTCTHDAMSFGNQAEIMNNNN